MENKLNPTNIQQSPALRMEAGSINCIVRKIFIYAANRNLLTVADSLPAHYVEYLLLMRLIILIHLIRRTPRVCSVLFLFNACSPNALTGENRKTPPPYWLFQAFSSEPEVQSVTTGNTNNPASTPQNATNTTRPPAPVTTTGTGSGTGRPTGTGTGSGTGRPTTGTQTGTGTGTNASTETGTSSSSSTTEPIYTVYVPPPNTGSGTGTSAPISTGSGTGTGSGVQTQTGTGTGGDFFSNKDPLAPSTGVAQTGSGTGTGTGTGTPPPPPPTGNSTPPNGVPQLSAGTPTLGIYFFHPDHTGSISMVTDGAGRMMTDTSGASQLTYKPYGEVNRMNSYGPDIFRYKYTGQQDDQDTGLYYYKARYYDPVLGLFTSADNVTNATSSFGLNHYMYVEGNPVRWGDDSGNSISPLLLGAIAGYFLAEQNPQWGLTPIQGAFLGAYAMSGNTNIGKDMAGGLRWAGNGIDHAAREALARTANTVSRTQFIGAINGYYQAEQHPEWGLSPMQGAFLGAYVMSGNTNITKDMIGGLKWASGGLHRAGDTINYYTGNSKNRQRRGDFERSDFGRSDSGKMWSGIANFYDDVYFGKGLSHAIAKSDLGRSDLGREFELGKGCAMDVAVTAMTVLLIPYLGPVGVVMKAVGQWIIPVPQGCRPEGSYFGQ